MKRTSILATLLLVMGAAKADVIELTTSKPVGEKISIALNAGGQTTLAWGNGETQTVKFDGKPAEFEVKATTLTITTENPLTRFYAPASGITEINLSEAQDLKQLFVSDNELEALDLNYNRELRLLDAQNNKLTELNLRNHTAIEFLNCANNELSTLSINTGDAAQLRTLICSNNKLKSLPSFKKLTAFETLWANGNEITSNIVFNNAATLRTLVIESNGISRMTLPAAFPYLSDFWASGNKLTTIDFSAGTPLLRNLSVAGNTLSAIKWATDFDNAMDYVNLSGNALFFNSFPPIDDVEVAVLAPQANFSFLESTDVNVEIDMATFMQKFNGSRDTRRKFAMFNSNGTELTKSKTGDFNYTQQGKFTFYTPQSQAYIEATTREYDGVTLTSLPFNVIDPTGIEDVITDAGNSAIEVYDTQGRLVAKSIEALAAGIYVINGKKYLVK